MKSRFAHLLLVVVFLVAGLTSCPNGGACPSMQQAAHKCCAGASDSIRAADCCSDGHRLADRALGTERGPEWSLPVAFETDSIAPLGSPLFVRRVTTLERALAPPGTLLAQHTSLLL